MEYYNVTKTKNGMNCLKAIFNDGHADQHNICLFSTSGVHGSYRTIEEEEADPGDGVTFLVIQPRIVSMIYGVAYPVSYDDFNFLKKLRQTSREWVNAIGG